MYSKTCASRTCFNTSRTRPDLTFFSFPKSEHFTRAWAEACSYPELKNKSPDQLTQLYLCAEHFEDKCFTDPKEKTMLIKWNDIYSIPTIFNHNTPNPAEQNSGLQSTNPVLKLLLKGCTNSRLQKICRLCSCLKPTQSLVPIYGSYYQPLMVKLQPFGIFLSLNDGLPSHICRTCAAKLLLCVETLEQFHESELKLKLAGSTEISTITYDQPGILNKIVINKDSNEANENNISLSVPTSSQQEEPEKGNLESRNDCQVEDMAVNEENNENFVKVEVMDEESNTLDSNQIDIDIDLPIVKQEVEIEEVPPVSDEYLLPTCQLKNKAEALSDKTIKIERSSSDDLISCTPPELNIVAQNSSDDLLLPSKSKAQYESAYNAFADWKKKCDTQSSFETVLMAYFDELSKKYKPSSLWSIYSMLKRTLNIKEKIDIGAYPRLTAYLKKQSAGFHSKKTHVFSSEEVHKFLTEAPDYEFLATKGGRKSGKTWKSDNCFRQFYKIPISAFNNNGQGKLGNFGESTLPHPVSFIDFQDFATISNEKEQTNTVLEHDPLSDEFRTTCKHCRRIFISTAFLMKHIENEHMTDQTSPDIVSDPKIKQYKCKVCNAMLSSAIAYLSHLKMHAAKTPGIEITNLRTEVFPSTDENSSSNPKKHKDIDEAKDLPRKFRKVSLLRRTARQDFKCDLCELSFPKKDELLLHFNMHKIFLCDMCGDKFWRQEDFQDHKETHKPVIADRYINKPFRIEIENTPPVQNIQVTEKETTEENNFDKSTNLEVKTESEICFVDVPIKEEKVIPIVDIEEGPSSKHQILENQKENEARISTRLDLLKSEYKSKEEVDYREESKDTNDLVYISDESSEESDPDLKEEIEKVLADRNKMYVCENCAAVFSTKVGVTNHILKEHPDDIESKNSYTRHEVDNKFLCAICNLNFGTVGTYELHLQRHMSTSVNLTRKVCSICGYKFSSDKMYTLHMHNHRQRDYEENKAKKNRIFDLKDLKCIFCGEQFNTNSMLMTHLKSAHMLSCKQCNEEFETDESLKNHMRKTHRESKYICNICGDHFASQESIYEHIAVHGTGKTEKIHDKLEKPLRCKICHATLKTTYTMKCHMDKHRGVKDAFACDKCEMRFDICSKLDEHLRKHEPKVDFDRPHACTVCDSKFILETALKRHYLREHFTYITSVTNGKRKLLESQIMDI